MTDEERLYILAIMALWAVVWVCIVAVLKARQSEKEKKEEREYMGSLFYISNTDFWKGMSIWWPVLLVLSPFYLLYKAVFKIAKPKEE